MFQKLFLLLFGRKKEKCVDCGYGLVFYDDTPRGKVCQACLSVEQMKREGRW